MTSGGNDGSSNRGGCRGNDISSDADNDDKNRQNGENNEKNSGGGTVETKTMDEMTGTLMEVGIGNADDERSVTYVMMEQVADAMMMDGRTKGVAEGSGR